MREKINKIKNQVFMLAADCERLLDTIPGCPPDLNCKKDVQSLAVFLGLDQDLEKDTLLHAILQCAREVVNAGGAGLTLYDRKIEKLVFRAAVGDGAEKLIGYEVPLSDSQHGLAFVSGEIHSSTPIDNGAENKAGVPFRNVMVAPLFVVDEGVGTMSAVNKQDGDHFTQEDMQSFQRFSDLAAQVVQQKLREETVRAIFADPAADHEDSLTPVQPSGGDTLLMEIIQNVVRIANENPGGLPTLRQITKAWLEDTSTLK